LTACAKKLTFLLLIIEQKAFDSKTVELRIKMSSAFYELRPIQLGCKVFGIDLKSYISDEIKEVIRDSVIYLYHLNEHIIFLFISML